MNNINETLILASKEVSGAAAGMVKMLIFLLVLLLLFWILNIFRHIKIGWTRIQKAADITGAVLLIAAIAALALPLLH